MAKKNNNISIEDLKDVILSETDEKYDLSSEPSEIEESSKSEYDEAMQEMEEEK